MKFKYFKFRRDILLLLCLTFLTGCVTINMNVPYKKTKMKTLSSKFKRRTYICYRATAPIKITGKMESAAWKKAFVVKHFYTWGKDNKLKPAVFQTTVKILWDSKYLYVGAHMIDHDIEAYYTKFQSPTYNDDVFEIFIKPSEKSYNFYEIEINPRNATLQLFLPRQGLYGELQRYYDNNMRIKSAVSIQGLLNNWRVKSKGWTAELRIPFSAFKPSNTPAPQNGTKWRIAFCRYDYDYYLPKSYFNAVELSSSAKLAQPNFHLYQDYDNILFVDKPYSK